MELERWLSWLKAPDLASGDPGVPRVRGSESHPLRMAPWTAWEFKSDAARAQVDDSLWRPGDCPSVRMTPSDSAIAWVGPLLLSRGELARLPDGVPGIYILHLFAAEYGAYPVLYVGKSTNLRRRLHDHVDDLRAKKLFRIARREFRMYFSAAPVMSPRVLDRIESALIRAFRPAGNQQIPAAEPVSVNLPPLTI